MQYYVMQSGDYVYIVETDCLDKAQTRSNKLVAVCENEYHAQLLVAAMNTNRAIIAMPYDQVMDTQAWHCASWPLRTWLCNQHKIEINDTVCPVCPNDNCLGKR